MENSVREFASEQPDADYAAIVKWFGKPEKIAENFVMEMDAASVVGRLRIIESVFHATVISAIIIVILWLGVVSLAMMDHHNRVGGYYMEEISEIDNDSYVGGNEYETYD